MRKLFCLIVLAAFISINHGGALAQTPTSVATFPQKEEIIELGETWPDTPILSGLKSEIEKHWVGQGGFWFSKETSDGMIWQIGDVSCQLQPKKLTSPDRLNGIQWRGLVSFSWQAERFFLPEQGKWTRWKTGNGLWFEVYVENGKTDFQEVGSLTHPRTGKKSDLVKLEKIHIQALIEKPKMTAAESEKLFPFGFSFGKPESPDTRPRVLSMPKPEYTEEGRVNKITGKVVLAVEVRANGSVGRVSIIRSLGYGLDEKAIETVRRGRFSPATLKGEPVASTARVEVNFNVY